MFGRNLLERHFRTVLQPFAVALLQLFNVLLERRRLFQSVTQVKTDDAQRQRQEERNTPAPVEEVLFTDDGRDQNHNPCAHDEPGNRAKVEPAAHKAAFTVRGILGDKNRCAGIFAANREALRHLTDQQQDRRPYTNGRIGRNKADTECTYRHDDNGNSQDLLATIFITQHAEEKATERTNQEGNGERTQRSNHLQAGIGTREEHFTKCIGHKAVNTKIEPLHRITERGRCNRFAQFRVINNGDIAQRDGFYFFPSKHSFPRRLSPVRFTAHFASCEPETRSMRISLFKRSRFTYIDVLPQYNRTC